MFKKTFILSALFILVTLNAQMLQTPHNLSVDASDAENSQLCEYCHPPQLSDTPFSKQLWNNSKNKESFSLYSGALSDTPSSSSTPHSYSMICLSCHDGVNSVNFVVNNSYNNAGETVTKSNGFNYQHVTGGDHPISIVYEAGKAKGLKPITTPLIGEWKGAKTISDILRNGKVECGTCHDPHSMTDDGLFLRNKNERSELCLSCHDK